MAETIESRIEEDAITGVSRMTVDGTSVDSMSIDERIKAAEYLAKKKLAKKYAFGIVTLPLTPGGCG